MLAPVALLVASTWLSALPPLGAGPDAWSLQALGGIRGVTVGPIENTRHPGRGYGSRAYQDALDEAVRMGATWVSLTPFGRVWNLDPGGVHLTFEAPFEENRANVLAAIRQARALGLRVLVVPHLWVESGEWRALIDPKGEAGWARWTASYRDFVLTWARVAAEGGADMFSVGVELRTWVTGRHASSFVDVIHDVREVFPGLLTYSANWDDADHTLVFGELDLIGINGFYPLAERESASASELLYGGQRVSERVATLADEWDKPVVFTEIGYTNRTDPALRPWEWPESLENVTLDQQAQADAYRGIIAPIVSQPWCAGFFMWRLYADPDDVSQEPEYGFSPRGKLAELLLRDAFTARWAADGPSLPGSVTGRHRARVPGVLGWDLSPALFDEP